MKQFTRQVRDCLQCPNFQRIAYPFAICSATHRSLSLNTVAEEGIPEWCPLPNASVQEQENVLITPGHKANFETLRRAFANQDVCLMECIDTQTERPACVVCATMRDHEGTITMVPLAVMVEDNPYERFVPPTEKAE